MQDIRCGSCNRKLGAGEYLRLAIKCPRCGTMNQLRAERPASEGPRASCIGDTVHEARHSRQAVEPPSS
ncbi:Com family DNA-binding transcriptional regulator [Cupriavidus sp. SW-Y-13]|uniref:Com family DNA-binding transcriptional regulator n=1 Tax=Cupriavidus sp. SW-Y-13 TaxID=2653854 RepID=UPI001365C7BB|nr:Com family DNA-binding transcriptional regulator [Cupriavidus sp. SW-Y-13]MWL87141.1 Com family DNA-binding transcriptional regulator [Cupriavidus sp. SW-Y-13]